MNRHGQLGRAGDEPGPGAVDVALSTVVPAPGAGVRDVTVQVGGGPEAGFGGQGRAQAAQLRLPGYLANAAQCMPAFDAFLNTSRYEGLSIAT